MSLNKVFDKLEKTIDKAMGSLNRITIVTGRNVVVRNGSVIVDGKTIKENLKGEATVKFKGDLASLDCAAATINGNVKGNVDGTTINILGNVGGNIDGTTINCGNVTRDVDGTTINCGNIGGRR